MRNNKGIGIIWIIVVIFLGVAAVVGGGVVAYLVEQSNNVSSDHARSDKKEKNPQKEDNNVIEVATEKDSAKSLEDVRMEMYEKFLNSEITAEYNGKEYKVWDLIIEVEEEVGDPRGVSYTYLDAEKNNNVALEIMISEDYGASYYVFYYDGESLKANEVGWHEARMAHKNQKYIERWTMGRFGYSWEYHVFCLDETYQLQYVQGYYTDDFGMTDEEKKQLEEMGFISEGEYYENYDIEYEKIEYKELETNSTGYMKLFEEYAVDFIKNNGSYRGGGFTIYYKDREYGPKTFQVMDVEGRKVLIMEINQEYNYTNECIFEDNGKLVRPTCGYYTVGYNKTTNCFYNYMSITQFYETTAYRIENGEERMLRKN